jgi:hypothetical protein
MRKNDVIKWEARLTFIAVDIRKDSKGVEYSLLRTAKGSRVLTWDLELIAKIVKELEQLPLSKWICKGYINQVLGNSFLVLSEAESVDELMLKDDRPWIL